MCWVMLKCNEMFQVLGNQWGGGAQQNPGLRWDMLNGSEGQHNGRKLKLFIGTRSFECLADAAARVMLRRRTKGSVRRAGNTQLNCFFFEN